MGPPGLPFQPDVLEVASEELGSTALPPPPSSQKVFWGAGSQKEESLGPSTSNSHIVDSPPGDLFEVSIFLRQHPSPSRGGCQSTRDL